MQATARGTAPTLRITGRMRAGPRILIAGFDLTLPGGRWSVLLGPSGIGKTSLLRRIAGLPCAVTLDGQVTAGDGLPVAPRTAMMAQDDQLLPWADALANVTIGARLRGERPRPDHAAALLAAVGLAGREGHRPAALSAGQRQRVALARTLHEDRDIVLLDEPFSALDALTRHRVQDLAFRLLAGRTVVLITHDPAEAVRLADQALIAAPGGITPCPLPTAPPPRPAEDATVLAAQAALLRRMRRLVDEEAAP